MSSGQAVKSAPQKPLCDACSQFDLRHDTFTRQGKAKYENLTVPLGTVSEVRLRSQTCALCKLVSILITNSSHDQLVRSMGRETAISDDKAVNLSHTTPRNLKVGGLSVMASANIRFINPRPETVSVGHDARLISPNLVDLRLINRWKRACERHHHGACKIVPAYNGRELTSLRYVDVERNCIVDAPLESKYVALSYIWGRVATLKLCRQNVNLLYQPYSLDDVWNSIPKTIKDAIELTRDLHQPYLWVDTLCLIQDDERDMAAGLKMMDVVYEQSEVTIIAASGPDAQSGLPGYSPTEDRRQVIENINGVSLAVIRELSGYMGDSDYNQRGWTFQEQYISRKRLIFVGNKVYWNCLQANWGEESPDEYEASDDNYELSNIELSLAFGADALWMSAFEVLDTCIKYYSRRQLSFEKDAINAISGLLDRIAVRMCCRFLHGLPTAIFDLGVVFEKFPDHVLKRRKRFPSWCWAGWKGPVWGWSLARLGPEKEIDTRINRWIQTRTWIVWYKRSSSGYLSPVWDPAANESFEVDSSTPGYRSRKPFVPPAGLRMSCSRTAPTEKGAEMRAQPHPYHLLQFWTVTAVFKCRKDGIFDKLDRICGLIEWDGFLEEQAPARIRLAVLSEHVPDKHFKGGIDPLYLDDEVYYLIMALFPVNGGYEERRGIGELCASALRWTDEPAQWEEIILG